MLCCKASQITQTISKRDRVKQFWPSSLSPKVSLLRRSNSSSSSGDSISSLSVRSRAPAPRAWNMAHCQHTLQFITTHTGPEPETWRTVNTPFSSSPHTLVPEPETWRTVNTPFSSSPHALVQSLKHGALSTHLSVHHHTHWSRAWNMAHCQHTLQFITTHTDCQHTLQFITTHTGQVSRF